MAPPKRNIFKILNWRIHTRFPVWVLCWRQFSLKLQLFWDLFCGWFAGCSLLLPFLSAPCSPSSAFGGKFLPLLAYVCTWSCLLPAWLTLFLCWAPLSMLDSVLWARVLREGSYSVLQASVGRGNARSPSLLLLRVKQIKRRYSRTFSLSLYKCLQASCAFGTRICTAVWKFDAGEGWQICRRQSFHQRTCQWSSVTGQLSKDSTYPDFSMNLFFTNIKKSVRESDVYYRWKTNIKQEQDSDLFTSVVIFEKVGISE